MATFIDGPAKGVHVSVSRAPIVLRVVQNPKGKFDCLDKLDDKPEPDEKIFLYMMRGRITSSGFVDGRDPETGKRTGHAFSEAEYTFFSEQPADSDMRTKPAWDGWCKANEERLVEMYAKTMPAPPPL